MPKLKLAITTGLQTLLTDRFATEIAQATASQRIAAKFADRYEPIFIAYEQHTAPKSDMRGNDAVSKYRQQVSDYFDRITVPAAGFMCDREVPIVPGSPSMVREQLINMTIAAECKRRGHQYYKYGAPTFAWHDQPWGSREDAFADAWAFIIAYLDAWTPCFYLPCGPYPSWASSAYRHCLDKCERMKPGIPKMPVITRCTYADPSDLTGYEPRMAESEVRQQVREIAAAGADGLVVWANVDPVYPRPAPATALTDAPAAPGPAITVEQAIAASVAEIEQHLEIVAAEWQALASF